MMKANNTAPAAFRSAVILLNSEGTLPWWWDEIRADAGLCPLEVRNVSFRNKTSKQVNTLELPLFLLQMLPVYLKLRRDFDYMFTFECSLTTWAMSFWQTLLFSRKPRHIVLQFIMRPKTRRLASRLKYRAMQWCFQSLHLAICSSRDEARYYATVFGWPAAKTAFVPYHTSARHLALDGSHDRGYIMAAGRAFRDYPTLYTAMEHSNYRLIVVATHTAPRPHRVTRNIEFLAEISLSRFEALMAEATLVVVPLEDLPISTGQLVIILAMSLGKPVIATRTAGTVDYITDGIDGILVRPSDPAALRNAIDHVMSDVLLRQKLGRAARSTMQSAHLPHHYTSLVREALRNIR